VSLNPHSHPSSRLPRPGHASLRPARGVAFGKKPLVSASEIANLFHCEQKIVLDRRHGERHTREQVQAQQRGIAVHDAVDRQARAQHNQPQSKPGCFVATHVYGDDDPRTWELRRFRDRALMPSAMGRWLVRWYYRHSPRWVVWLNRHPRLTAPIRRVLDAARWLTYPLHRN